MRLSLLTPMLVITAFLAGCAPSTAPVEAGGDEMTGTLKVWLYDEANREKKQEVIDAAVEEFTAAHEGVQVDVAYIASDDSRFERFKGAFNDPASAPDVAEYGNTDLPGYVEAGGFADVSADAKTIAPDISADLMDTAAVDGKTYGVPWFIGIRALYYRTDVFERLGLDPPKTMKELTETAKKIKAAEKDMVGISVGGLYTFGMAPFLWAHGGELATEKGGRYAASITTPQAKAGIKAYTDLLSDDICPPPQCADATGGDTVEMFASGKAGMAILPNSSRSAVEDGAAVDKYAVVPLPGTAEGTIAPAFAGGNNLGVLRNAPHRTLAREFIELLAGPEYQRRMYDAMGNLPTLSSLRKELTGTDPFLKPFSETIDSGTRFVPVTPAWSKIDAQSVLQNMMQKIASGKSGLDAATTEAAGEMDAAFSGD